MSGAPLLPGMIGELQPRAPAQAAPEVDDFQRLVSVLLATFVGSILAGVIVAGVLAAAVDQRRSVSDRPPPAIRLGGAWTASRLSPGDQR